MEHSCGSIGYGDSSVQAMERRVQSMKTIVSHNHFL